MAKNSRHSARKNDSLCFVITSNATTLRLFLLFGLFSTFCTILVFTFHAKLLLVQMHSRRFSSVRLALPSSNTANRNFFTFSAERSVKTEWTNEESDSLRMTAICCRNEKFPFSIWTEVVAMIAATHTHRHYCIGRMGKTIKLKFAKRNPQ